VGSEGDHGRQQPICVVRAARLRLCTCREQAGVRHEQASTMQASHRHCQQDASAWRQYLVFQRMLQFSGDGARHDLQDCKSKLVHTTMLIQRC